MRAVHLLAWILLAVAAAVALGAAHLALWTWYYRARHAPDERHYVRTVDGWTIALARIRGAGPPVLCCPGLACNGRLFDLDERHSFARYLAGRGFDVWMLDPRGTGESERPRLGGRGWRFGFDEYVRQDAAAAVGYVTRATGHARVLWVGHSMGGLIGLHLGARFPEGRAIGALCMLGSPLDFSKHRQDVGPFIHLLDWTLRGWPVVRLGRLCRLVIPLAGWVRGLIEPLFHNPKNIPVPVLRRFLATVIEDVPRKLLDQFADAVFRQRGFDGGPAEAERATLERFDRPVVSFAGAWDRIASPHACSVDSRIVSSLDCSAHIVGRDDGSAAEIGHMDLLIGETAPALVYPRIADWLLARAATRSASSGDTPPSRASDSSGSQPD